MNLKRPRPRRTRLVEFLMLFFSVVGAANLVLGLISGTKWDEAWRILTSTTGQTVAAVYSLAIALLLRQAGIFR